jgi:tetratricopeptide (TPR) repeat protein
MIRIILPLLIATALWAADEAPICDPLSEVGCPRALALGNAYVAAANSWASISYNAAATAFRGSAEFSAEVDALGLPVTGQMLSVGFPTYQSGVIGGRLVTLGASNIDGRDAAGNPTSKFAARDWRLDLNYSYPFLKYLGAGLTYKQYWRNMTNSTKSFGGLDIGFLAKPIAQYNEHEVMFNVGVGVENLIAPHTGLRNKDLTWPRLFRVGFLLGHANPFGSLLGVALVTEADFITGAVSRLRGGVEVSYAKMVNLRAGLDQGHINAGLGISFDYGSLDYAALFTDISLANCAALNYSFDFTVAKLRQKRVDADELVADGREYYELGNYADALVKFNKAKDLEPRDQNISRLAQKAEIESLFKSGKANFIAEKYEAAVSDFSSAKILDPTDRRIAGYLELAEQRLQLAREIAERRNKAIDLVDQARAQQRNRNYRKAMSLVREALQYDPDVNGGRDLLAMIKRDIAREEAAKQVPPITTEIEFPDEAHAQYRRGLNSMQTGSYSNAVNEFNSLYQRYPGYPGLSISLSKAYTYLATEAFTQGRLAESISLLKIALQYDSSNERATKLLERAQSELLQIRGER